MTGSVDTTPVRIIRSNRRRTTVQAREVNGVIEVRAPASMPDAELTPIVAKLVQRLQRRKRKASLDDQALERRAQQLNRAHFDGKLRWESIRWVTNQDKRYGSCTPANGAIRISHRLAAMPGFVLDYVIVHELAHLLEPNHGKRFWRLVNHYAKSERARGYLMAVGLEELEE